MPSDGYGQSFEEPGDRRTRSNPLEDAYSQRTPSSFGQTGDPLLAAAERAAIQQFQDDVSAGIDAALAAANAQLEAALNERGEGTLSEEAATKQPPYVSTTAIPVREKQDLEIATSSVVRRPGSGMLQLRGVTRISIQATSSGGELVPLLNSTYPGGRGIETTNFMIVETSYAHDAPLIQKATQNAVYLIAKGRSLPVYSVSGILFQARNFPWFSEFMANYHNYLAGDQAIRNNTVVRVESSGRIYLGYIANVRAATRSNESGTVVPFSFNMLVVEESDAPEVRFFTQDGEPLQAGSIIDVYAELMREQGLSNKIAEDSARSIVRGELLEGQIDGVTPVATPILPEAGTEDTPFRLDLNQAIAATLAVNAHAGRTVYDVNSVRRGYLRSAEAATLAASRPRPANAPTDRTYEVASDEIEGARSSRWADRVTSTGTVTGTNDSNAYYGVR